MKIKLLLDALGPEAKLHKSAFGKNRILYKQYAFCWFEKQQNYRGWIKDPESKFEYGGYDRCIGNFKTIQEILTFLEITPVIVRNKPLFLKATAAINELKEKVSAFKMFAGG